MTRGPHLFYIHRLSVGKEFRFGKGTEIRECEFRKEGGNVTQTETRTGLVMLVKVLCWAASTQPRVQAAPTKDALMLMRTVRHSRELA